MKQKSKLLEQQLREANIENSRLAGLTALYQKNVDKLNSEKKDILRKTKEDAEIYLRGVNSKIERVIKELKESNAKSTVIKESQVLITKIKDENKNIFKEIVDLKEIKTNFAVGEFVCIKNTETKGEIIEISKDNKKAVVNTGKMKMTVPVDNLLPAKPDKEKASGFSNYNYNIISPEIRLDIRRRKAGDG